MTTEEERRERLIKRLREALEEFKRDPLGGRISAVLAAKWFIDESDFIPNELMEPLEDAVTSLIDAWLLKDKEGAPGPKPKSWLELNRQGYAAAIVSILLYRDWTLDDAIRRAAKETKIDPKRLQNLRDNILRGVANPIVMQMYDDRIEEIRAMTVNELLTMLSHLRSKC